MKIQNLFKRKKWKVWLVFISIICAGMLLPEKFVMPVQGADKSSYNQKSFWFNPWGKSGTHKGVDIFATIGTRLNSATHGLVLYKGTLERGGKCVVVLGPKWRIHYYAHLHEISCSWFDFVYPNEQIGKVGDSGNAKGKPPHLHYSISTLIPYPHRIDTSPQGWKKMFYLDPVEKLNKVDR